MATLDTLQSLSLPTPARAFVRLGGEKMFGGFVLAVQGERLLPAACVDEVWQVEITFVRRLGSGRAATGLRLDQVMTGQFLVDPSTLSR
jgi:hypothetical protein